MEDNFPGTEEESIQSAERMIQRQKKFLKELPQRTDEYYQLYSYFCDEIVSKLFEQSMLDIIKKLPDFY